MPYVFLVAAAARVWEGRVPARRSIAACSMHYCRHCIQPLPSEEAGADEKETGADEKETEADEKRTDAGADEKKLDAAEADEKETEADAKKLDAAEADSR